MNDVKSVRSERSQRLYTVPKRMKYRKRYGRIGLYWEELEILRQRNEEVFFQIELAGEWGSRSVGMVRSDSQWTKERRIKSGVTL